MEFEWKRPDPGLLSETPLGFLGMARKGAGGSIADLGFQISQTDGADQPEGNRGGTCEHEHLVELSVMEFRFGFVAVGEDEAEKAVQHGGSDLSLGKVGCCLEHAFPGFVRESLLYGANALHARECSIAHANARKEISYPQGWLTAAPTHLREKSRGHSLPSELRIDKSTSRLQLKANRTGAWKMTPGVPARRILIVDDEASVRDAIRRMLIADGYEVEMAASAEEALEVFGRAKFNLVITDYALPLQKGDQLADAIKAIDPHQPVALMTAYAEAIRYAGTPLETVDLVIDKPISWYQFRQAVAKLLGP